MSRYIDLKIASRERHERFVRRVAAGGLVWGLKCEDGWAVSSSNDTEDEGAEERTVYPFWSDRAYAARVARNDWAHYEPASIPLVEFLDAWLPGMAAEGHLVGTNWNAYLVGLEVEPLDLLDQILDKMGDGKPEQDAAAPSE